MYSKNFSFFSPISFILSLFVNSSKITSPSSSVISNIMFNSFSKGNFIFSNFSSISSFFSLPLLKIGDVYFENNQFKDAEIAYKSALKIEKLPEIYLRLGVLYNTRYQFEKAEKTFREGLSLDYKPEIAYNLSYTLTRLGKHFQALQLLKELANNYPTSEVYNELGLLQKHLGFYEEAEENLKLAGEQFKENYLKVKLFTKGLKQELIEELKNFSFFSPISFILSLSINSSKITSPSSSVVSNIMFNSFSKGNFIFQTF